MHDLTGSLKTATLNTLNGAKFREKLVFSILNLFKSALFV